MLEFAILGSGSAGNSALVRSGDTLILVDAGLSCRQLCDRMARLGVGPGDLDGILLTHEHGDHTRGLDVFCRNIDVPVFCNPLTREILAQSLKGPKSWKLTQTGAEFRVGGISITAFSVPHDAVDPVGFLIRDPTAALGFISDVGFVTAMVKSHLRGADLLFVEANYDDGLLQNDTKRPWSTKQRIMSRHGHLSNAQAAECVAALCHPGLAHVILGHLSRDCNRPDLAGTAVRSALDAAGGADVGIACAVQEEPTAWFQARSRTEPSLRIAESPADPQDDRAAPRATPTAAREHAPSPPRQASPAFAPTIAFEQMDLFA